MKLKEALIDTIKNGKLEINLFEGREVISIDGNNLIIYIHFDNDERYYLDFETGKTKKLTKKEMNLVKERLYQNNKTRLKALYI